MWPVRRFLLLFFATIFSISFADDNVRCHTGATDVVFVMDQSGSVGINNFNIGLDAAANLTKWLTVGTAASDSRVGFVGFDSTAYVEFELTTYSTNAEVEKAIHAVTYTAGDTNIARGMASALMLFVKSHRENVQKVMIIITDGEDASDVRAQHFFANALGIDTYAVGVGTDVKIDDLIKATGDPEKVIIVQDYAKLYEALATVCYEIGTTVVVPKTTTTAASPQNPTKSSANSSVTPSVFINRHASCGCDDIDNHPEIVTDTWLDIIFVLDTSSEVSQENFNSVKSFLEMIGENYQIGASRAGQPLGKYTRVAIISTAETARVIANLTTFTDGQQLIKTARGLQLTGGYFLPETGISAAYEVFSQQARKNARTVIIVFSSEIIDCSTSTIARSVGIAKGVNYDMCEKVAQLKNDGVVIITVAVSLGGETDAPLINIAEPCYRFRNNLDMMVDVIRGICLANCYCESPYTQFEVPDLCEKSSECIYVHNAARTYGKAKSTCAANHEILADALSGEKDDFLKALHTETGFVPYWLGGKITKETIVWESGTNTSATASQGDYTNWYSNDATDSTQPRISASGGFDLKWMTEADGAIKPIYYFSCQKSACSVLNYCNE